MYTVIERLHKGSMNPDALVGPCMIGGPGGARSVLFEELPPLGGLPQQMPEVVGVLLGLAVGGQRPGHGAPVSARHKSGFESESIPVWGTIKRCWTCLSSPSVPCVSASVAACCLSRPPADLVLVLVLTGDRPCLGVFGAVLAWGPDSCW